MEKSYYIYGAGLVGGFVGGFLLNCVLITMYTMKHFRNETIRPKEEGPYCIYCNK